MWQPGPRKGWWISSFPTPGMAIWMLMLPPSSRLRAAPVVRFTPTFCRDGCRRKSTGSGRWTATQLVSTDWHLWDTNSRYPYLDEWSMIRRLGHEEELSEWAPDQWPAYRQIPLHSLGGQHMDSYSPHWSARVELCRYRLVWVGCALACWRMGLGRPVGGPDLTSASECRRVDSLSHHQLSIMFFAIFTAIGAPLGLLAAKNS